MKHPQEMKTSSGKKVNRTSNPKGSKGRLYRNESDSTKNHPFFKDVSTEAGITLDGFGHGATITDINRDGWKDIYVSNDFLSENILFIINIIDNDIHIAIIIKIRIRCTV